MKIVSMQGQLTFDEMKGSLEHLPKANGWVQMGDNLPWSEFENIYNMRLKNDHVGVSNRPERMAIVALYKAQAQPLVRGTHPRHPVKPL